MLDEAEIAFLRARLAEDEVWAKQAAGNPPVCGSDATPEMRAFVSRFTPVDEMREAEVWRRVLLEYQIPPGTDAVYGHTERETGFRLALAFVLKAKVATYKGHPDYPGER